MKSRDAFLILSLAGAILAKWGYAHADHAQLAWVLQPTSYLVQWFTGVSFQYHPSLGYLFPTLDFTIDRSCAGANFLIILSSASIATLPPLLPERWQRLLAALSLALVSFVITIFANTSRILSLHKLLPIQDQLAPDPARWFHAGVGAVIYLFFLFASYLAFYKIMKPFSSHLA